MENNAKYRLLTEDEQRFVSVLRLDMATNVAEAGYSLFASMMNMRALEDCPKTSPLSSMTIGADHTFTLAFDFAVWRRLGLLAAKELLKMHILRIPYGHISHRGMALAKQYGPKVLNTASQLVLSELVNTAILADAGVKVAIPEMWNLPRNKTLEFYCASISNGGQALKTPGKTGTSAERKLDPEIKDRLQSAQDENGLTKLADIESACVNGEGSPDEASREMLNRFTSAAESNSRLQGFLRGDALEFIKALNAPPVVHWESILQRFASSHIETDRWEPTKRPARRNIIVKGPNGEDNFRYYRQVQDVAPQIVFVVDTSGSMSSVELSMVDAELHGIVRAGAIVDVLQVDSAVAEKLVRFDEFGSLENFRGRGGTDFRPAFNYLTEHEIQPDCLVYFTDGQGTAPSTAPPYDVLWLLTPGGYTEDQFRGVCKWGDTAKITRRSVG